MKRIIALVIAFVMCIALTACGNSEKEELYDKYESLIKSLERNNYDKALEKIEKLYKKHQESTSEKESGKDKKQLL
jgi:outer membrane protein assembly factor BamD (BamD/ComL family)